MKENFGVYWICWKDFDDVYTGQSDINIEIKINEHERIVNNSNHTPSQIISIRLISKLRKI